MRVQKNKLREGMLQLMDKNQIKARLLLTTALAVITWTGPVLAQTQTPAQAASPSAPAAPTAIEEIVVTGTSIRGVAPVGADLISTTRLNIEQTGAQTIEQVLKSVPAVTGLGAVTQGGYSSNDAAGAYGPTIHGLGGVNSNSTLVLIDGHRFPLSGVSGNIADPNFLPSNALERVEVLPEGASSVYGSDAVAGVINFITRRRFDGLELTGQTGFGDNYRTYDTGLAAGKTWDTGFAFLAYDYSDRSAIPQSSRPFTFPNHIPEGGTNNNTQFCGPASIQPTGSSSLYLYPYTTASSSAQTAAPCNAVNYSDLIPAENKQSVMLKFEQEVNDRLKVSGDLVYSERQDHQDISRGTLTALIYGPGSGKGGQINPFFVTPTGSTATSETVRLDLDNLLGPGAYAASRVETYYATGKAEYKLAGDWLVTGSFLTGVNTSTTTTNDTACISCALLALNGTTNSNGVTTQPSLIGTKTIVLNTPLTTANALDPFNPPASNLTSAAVRNGLIDGPGYSSARQSIQQLDFKIDGTIIKLPAGPLKIAAGAAYVYSDESPQLIQTLNIGQISQGAYTSTNLHYQRNVKSGYVEGLVPIISPEMGIPLVKKVDVDLSARYDDYSDFGSTFNPKFAGNWEVVSGFKLRGNIASSFVAPPLTAIGQNGVASYASIGQFLGPFSVPLSAYPQAKLIPACKSATTTCLFNYTPVQGLVIQGANAGLKAQKGLTWSIGADFAPHFLPGLTGAVTFWHNQFQGGVTSPIPALALNSPGFRDLLTIYPNGATAAQIQAAAGSARLTSVLPQTTYFIYNFIAQNALNLTVEGIDADIRYGHGFDWGNANGGVSFTYLTRFDQQVGAGSPTFSVLNTSGFNSTFPSIQLQMRADVGVTVGHASLMAFLNHTGGFSYWGNTAVHPVVDNAAGVPVGGGDKVKAYDTVDLHGAYDLASIAPKAVRKMQVFVDVTNLFNTIPPFENVVTAANNNSAIGGYDPFVGNPIGRVVTVGVRARF